jgi:hypothetical protein
MILLKVAHVADEFHKSKVQNNSFTMIMLQMNPRKVFKDVSYEFQIANTWFFNKLALAKSISKGMLPKF